MSVYNTNYFLLNKKSQYIWEIDSSILLQCIVMKTKHIIFFGNISELLYGLHFKSTKLLPYLHMNIFQFQEKCAIYFLFYKIYLILCLQS